MEQVDLNGSSNMKKYRRGDERDEMLADVAEMYYEEERTQAEISRTIGVSRSAVSRMLTEAREKGIVEITVHRPFSFDAELEETLKARFNLLDAQVLYLHRETNYDNLRKRLGQVAAQVLADLLQPNMICGVAWGTTVSATIEALQVANRIPLQVVQLVGVLGSDSHFVNAQALVQKMASKVGGEAVYLFSPLIVDSAATARSLLNNPDVRRAIDIGKRSDVALLGVGVVSDDKYYTLYESGAITRDIFEQLQEAGAVGDVSAHHFDVNGNKPDTPFHDRLVSIATEDLLAIPMRLGVAGGRPKAAAILGALRGGYVNHLVTDNHTAEAVLELAGESEIERKPAHARG